MSLETCECGKELLTEADPYAIIPMPRGPVVNCGCYFEKQVKKTLKTAMDLVDCAEMLNPDIPCPYSKFLVANRRLAKELNVSGLDYLLGMP